MLHIHTIKFKMNEENYLGFFYKLVETNQIGKKTKICKISPRTKLPITNTIKKLTDVKVCVIEVKLSNGKYLLLEDYSLNYFLSYTILIGSETEITTFNIIDDGTKTYVCEKELYIKIKSKVKVKFIGQIKPEDFYNLNFEYGFKQSKIIENVKEYILEKKKIDFNKIHIIKGSTIENFLPSVIYSHFRLGVRMNIPLVPLVENNFIRETLININDNISQEKILKPRFSYFLRAKWDFDKEKGDRLYRDIDSFLTINFNRKKLFKKYNNIKTTNFDKEDMLDKLKKLKNIEISANNGKLPIPLWKSLKTGHYLKITNAKKFCELSGRPFKVDEKLFKELYLQALSGDKVQYVDKKLKLGLETFASNIEETKIAIFENFEELVCNLVYHDNIEELIYLQNVKENHILELKKSLRNLIKRTTLLSIYYNKVPEETNPASLIEEYYLSVSNSIYLLCEENKNTPAKRFLFESILKYANLVEETLVTQRNEFRHLYFYTQIILSMLEGLKQADPNYAKNLHTIFQSYYETHWFKIRKAKINKELEELFYHVNKANKIATKKKVFIKIKKDFENEILRDNIKDLGFPEIMMRVVKPNTFVLKRIFPYSYKQISMALLKIKPDEIINISNIKIKGKLIELKKDYYNVHIEYKEYKQILDNQFFTLYSMR